MYDLENIIKELNYLKTQLSGLKVQLGILLEDENFPDNFVEQSELQSEIASVNSSILDLTMSITNELNDLKAEDELLWAEKIKYLYTEDFLEGNVAFVKEFSFPISNLQVEGVSANTEVTIGSDTYQDVAYTNSGRYEFKEVSTIILPINTISYIYVTEDGEIENSTSNTITGVPLYKVTTDSSKIIDDGIVDLRPVNEYIFSVGGKLFLSNDAENDNEAVRLSQMNTALDEKAEKNGDETEVFKVADSVSDDDATNQRQLNAEKLRITNLEATVSSGLVYPIPQSGNTPSNEPAPTSDGKYPVTTIGTFANFGGIVVSTLDNKTTDIIVSNGQTVFTLLQNDIINKADSIDDPDATEVPEAGAVFKFRHKNYPFKDGLYTYKETLTNSTLVNLADVVKEADITFRAVPLDTDIGTKKRVYVKEIGSTVDNLSFYVILCRSNTAYDDGYVELAPIIVSKSGVTDLENLTLEVDIDNYLMKLVCDATVLDDDKITGLTISDSEIDPTLVTDTSYKLDKLSAEIETTTNEKLSKPNEINKKLQTKIYGYSGYQLADESNIIEEQYIGFDGSIVSSPAFVGGNTDFIDVTSLDAIYYTGSIGVTAPIAVFFDDNDDVVDYYADNSAQRFFDVKIDKPVGATKVKVNARVYGYDPQHYAGFQLNKITEIAYKVSIVNQLSNLPLSVGFETESLDFIKGLVESDFIVGDVNYIDSCIKKCKEVGAWDIGLNWIDIQFGYKYTTGLIIPNLFNIDESFYTESGTATVQTDDRVGGKKVVKFAPTSRLTNNFTEVSLPISRFLCGIGGTQAYSLDTENDRYNAVTVYSDYTYVRTLLKSDKSLYNTTVEMRNVPFVTGGVFEEDKITAFFNDNKVTNISNSGYTTIDNAFVGTHGSTPFDQIFFSFVDLKTNDYDMSKELVKHINRYYGMFKDYRENAPLQMIPSNETTFAPTAGTMYYFTINKASDFPSINTYENTYFGTWSTDHDAGDGGLYWGTFSNLDMSDFVERGLFFDGSDIAGSASQVETASMVYNPDDPDGLPVYCYYQCYTGEDELQETRLIKCSGGLLHEATWTQVTPIAFPATKNGFGRHTGYQQVLRIDSENYVSWGLNKGTIAGEGNFCYSRDGITFKPYKITERARGVIPRNNAPLGYTFAGIFPPLFTIDLKRFGFGHAALIRSASLWDIETVLGTFIFEMKSLDEVGNEIYKISDTPLGAMLFDDNGYLHNYWYSIKTGKIVHEISDNNVFLSFDNDITLQVPWKLEDDLLFNDKRTKSFVNDFNEIGDAAVTTNFYHIGNRLELINITTVSLVVDNIFTEKGQKIEIFYKGTGTLSITSNALEVALLKNENKLLEADGQYSLITLEYQGDDGGVQQVAVFGDLKNA